MIFEVREKKRIVKGYAKGEAKRYRKDAGV